MAKNEINFMEFLQSFRRGELIREGELKLAELMKAVCDTGSGGTLTISLPFKMNKAGQIECTPDMKLKKPTRPMGTGIYFATDDAQLSRHDPNQMDMMDDLEGRRSRDN